MTVFAMLFPGQGSQYIGMLDTFLEYDIFKKTFDEASNKLKIDLWKLIQKRSKTILNNSQYTQPIILTTSVAIYKLWKKMHGKNPSLMSGHSLGEYSALVCANAIKFSDAVKIVHLRGKLMQKSIINRPSEMKAIIGLDMKIIKNICEKITSDKIVSLSSFNSIDQTVISGDKIAVKKAVLSCKKAGAKSINTLNINVPAHCSLMQPVCQKLEKILNKIKINKPKIPIINNADVKSENNRKKIINALIQQLKKPVRWKEIIESIYSKKIFVMLEIGPNKILTNLNKNKKDITSFSTNNLKNFLLALKKINQG